MKITNDAANAVFAFDMDGTSADFYHDEHCLERMFEPGFFAQLGAYENMVEAINKLRGEQNARVMNLSACITEQSRTEKKEWIQKYFGDGMETLLCDVGVSKAEQFEAAMGRKLTKSDFLVDDYSKNLIDWEQHGGTGIKFINEINGCGTNGYNFQGERVFYTSTSDEIVDELLRIARKQDKEPVDVRGEVDKILEKELGWEREDGVWKYEIYANYDDAISDKTMRKIFSGADPTSSFYELMDEWYGDTQYNLHEDTAEMLRKELYKLGGRFAQNGDRFIDAEVESKFSQLCEDYYWEAELPYEHYLKQEIKTNVFIGEVSISKMMNFINSGTEPDKVLPWLAAQQGKGIGTFHRELRDAQTESIVNAKLRTMVYGEVDRLNAEYVFEDDSVALEKKKLKELAESFKDNPKGFSATVLQELENAPYEHNDFVFLVTTTLEDLLMIRENMESFYRDDKAIVVPKNAMCGLYELGSGGGSILGVELEQDVTIPLSMIESIAPDGTIGYCSIEDCYGMCDSAWKARIGNIVGIAKEANA